MKWRIAEKKDIPLIAKIRMKQLMDEGQKPQPDIEPALISWFEKAMDENRFVEWLAEEDGTSAAAGAILFIRFPPEFINPDGMTGYICNIYTAPAFRGQGLASRMLSKLEEEARNRKVSHLWLEASRQGRPVYERFGFHVNEKWMELELDLNPAVHSDSEN